jgi:Zn-finger nucleic acid-binding protein
MRPAGGGILATFTRTPLTSITTMSTPSNTGYNEADRQFHEKDEQALKAIRAKLDADRAAAQAAQQKAAHWMRCPKCGSQMKEVAFQGVMIDQCGTCGGVYFDAGEFRAMSASQRHGSPMLEKLFSWMPSWRVGSDARPS